MSREQLTNFCYIFDIKGHATTIIVLYGECFWFYNTILSITEMIIVKCLLMYKWSQIAIIDDYFIAKMLYLTNFLISGILVITRISLAEYTTNVFFLRFEKSYNNIFDELRQNKILTEWHPIIRFW